MQSSKSPEGLLPLEHIEQFLARWERAESSLPAIQIADEFARGVVACQLGAVASLWLVKSGKTTALGTTDRDPPALPNPLPDSMSDQRVATFDRSTNQCRIIAIGSLTSGTQLFLDLHVGNKLPDQAIHQREEILLGLAEVAATAVLRAQHRTLQEQLSTANRYGPLLHVLCQEESLNESANQIASIVLDSSNADRVSILQTHPTGTTVLAVAPSGSIDRRSTQIKQLESLTGSVARQNRRFVYSVGDNNSTNGAELASEFIDQSGCRQLSVDVAPAAGIFPTRGAIVAETFDLQSALPDQSSSDQVLTVWQKIIDRQNTGFRGAIHRVKTSSAFYQAMGVVAGLLSLTMSMFFIPADFSITADGYLHPIQSRSIFSPNEGIVQELFVSNGDRIGTGQRLLSIRDPKLDLRKSQLTGEIATMQTQLASVRAARAQASRDRSNSTTIQLSAEEEDLKIQIEGLQQQLELVSDHMRQLIVASPIAGEVNRWDLEQSLENRPVNLGQHLLDVFDPKAGWELRLEIPDDVVGYVNAAQTQALCPVEFRVRSDPTKSYESKINSIARTAQIDSRGRTTVLGVSNLDAINIENPRGRAAVIAEIHCGRRSIGFVWFRELIEYFQRSFLL